MSDMSAISAAAMRVRTMADGSLRIECEVEPSDAQAAFALFGKPGAPMALAALRPGYQAAGNQPPPPPSYSTERDGAKGKGLARLAAMWCNSDHFQDWLARRMPNLWREVNETLDSHHRDHAEAAAEVVRQCCEVESRAELDNNEAAARIFNEKIRGPYREVLDQRG